MPKVTQEGVEKLAVAAPPLLADLSDDLQLENPAPACKTEGWGRRKARPHGNTAPGTATQTFIWSLIFVAEAATWPGVPRAAGGGPATRSAGRVMALPALAVRLLWRGEGRPLQTVSSAGGCCSAGSQCHLAASVPALGGFGGLEGPRRDIGRAKSAPHGFWFSENPKPRLPQLLTASWSLGSVGTALHGNPELVLRITEAGMESKEWGRWGPRGLRCLWGPSDLGQVS